MEAKQAIRRLERVGNADVFEALIARDVTRKRVLEEVLSFFGGRAQPMMSQLAEAGKVTLDDVRELEKTVRRLQREKEAK
jgi:predicted transcriptional regulator